MILDAIAKMLGGGVGSRYPYDTFGKSHFFSRDLSLCAPTRCERNMSDHTVCGGIACALTLCEHALCARVKCERKLCDRTLCDQACCAHTEWEHIVG